MTAIIQFISAHQTASALVAFWLGSNFVSALPSPNGSSGKFYQFFFGFVHSLAGSVPRVFPNLRIANPLGATQPYYKNGGSK
jgi:hypothetical protein